MIQIIRASMFTESQHMNKNEIQYIRISLKYTHVIKDMRLERRKLYPFLCRMNGNADNTWHCKLQEDT